ncbi:MAG: hypothetical protein HY717_03525 [Planctomycetes bacterium]|nr:hypothetical protein [Planctomycetota bacterium]
MFCFSSLSIRGLTMHHSWLSDLTKFCERKRLGYPSSMVTGRTCIFYVAALFMFVLLTTIDDSNGATSDVLRVTIKPDGTAGPMEIASVAEFPMEFPFVPIQSTASMSTLGDAQSLVCPNGPIPAPEPGCPSAPSGCPAMVTGLGVGRVISDDGSRIVMHGAPCDWASCADPTLCPDPNEDCCNNPPPACPNPIQQVYLRDMSRASMEEFPATFLVSKVNRVPEGCFAGNGCSRRASISGNGNVIAFSSFATDFRSTGCDDDCFEDVFYVSVNNIIPPFCQVPTRVSVVRCGPIVPNGHSFQPMLSTNGAFIGYASHSNNLLFGNPPCPDTNVKRDIFIHNTSTFLASIFSVDSAGAQANDHSFNPDVSGDGKIAVYESVANNLLGPDGDKNYLQDIFQTPSPQGPFIRGDSNNDAVVDMSDAVWTLNWISGQGPPPPCYDAADENDDGKIDQTDAINTLVFLFQGGQPPSCPFSCTPTSSCCGKDPSGDALPCGVTLSGCNEFAADGTCSRCPPSP